MEPETALKITAKSASTDMVERIKLVNGILGLTEYEIIFLAEMLVEMNRLGETEFASRAARKAMLERHAGDPSISQAANSRNYIKKLKEKGIIFPSEKRSVYHLSPIIEILRKPSLRQIIISIYEEVDGKTKAS